MFVQRGKDGGGGGQEAFFLVSEQVGEDRQGSLLHDLCGEVLPGELPAGAHEVQRRRGAAGGGEVVRVEGEEDRLWKKSMQIGLIVFQFLPIRVVGRFIEPEGKTAA